LCPGSVAELKTLEFIINSENKSHYGWSVIVAAECRAIVSEKKSIESPNKKLNPIKAALFSLMGYQYRNNI